jgi:hypothetical protein
MQELILIISRCVSIKKKICGKQSLYHFNFKGYYRGQKIKMIHLISIEPEQISQQFIKGDDYLLWVKQKQIDQEILVVELLKHKKIN